MKEGQHSNNKVAFDIRKRQINGKLFHNQKPKEEFILNTKKTMGKKYMQDANIFKQKHDEPKKQHRQIVMSEEFIKSSKLYRLLKEKMDRSDSIFIKEVNALNEHKMKLKEEIMQARSENYQEKVSLWELKNKLMELKIMYHEEEEESKRLTEQNMREYEGEEEYEGEGEGQNFQENGEDNVEQQAENELNRENEQMQEVELPYQPNTHIKHYPEMDPSSNHQSHQNKGQFTEILQELMNLKAERQQMQREDSEGEMKEEKIQKEALEQSYEKNYGEGFGHHLEEGGDYPRQ